MSCYWQVWVNPKASISELVSIALPYDFTLFDIYLKEPVDLHLLSIMKMLKYKELKATTD